MEEKKYKERRQIGKLISETIQINKLVLNTFEDMEIIQIGGANKPFSKKKETVQNIKFIHIIDTDHSAIEKARKRKEDDNSISFNFVNKYDNFDSENKFDGLFFESTFSSFRRENISEIINHLFAFTKKGGQILIKDLNYKKLYNENNKKVNLLKIDSSGNTYYKSEKAPNKESLKNTFEKKDIESLTFNLVKDFKWIEYEYHWIAIMKK